MVVTQIQRGYEDSLASHPNQPCFSLKIARFEVHCEAAYLKAAAEGGGIDQRELSEKCSVQAVREA